MDQIQFNSSRIGLDRSLVKQNNQVQSINPDFSKSIKKQKLYLASETAQEAEFTEIKLPEYLKHIDIYI